MPLVRTPEDLQSYLEQHGIEARLFRPAGETPTVEAAARAIGCTPEQVIKSVLFMVKRNNRREPALVLVAGTAPISYRALGEVFGVGRKKVRMATPDEVIAYTGYPVGGVPPFGHPQPLPTFVDQTVLAQPILYAGGGDDRTMMEISRETLLRITRATVIDVTSAP